MKTWVVKSNATTVIVTGKTVDSKCGCLLGGLISRIFSANNKTNQPAVLSAMSYQPKLTGLQGPNSQLQAFFCGVGGEGSATLLHIQCWHVQYGPMVQNVSSIVNVKV